MTALSEKEVEQIAEKAAERAVEETFIRLGINPHDPIEAQKDMLHLREWRLATTAIKSKAILGLVVVLVSGVAAALWIGFKELINR